MIRYAPLLPFFLYVLTIPLPSNAYFSDSVRITVANSRPMMVVAVLASTIVFGLALHGQRYGSYMRNPYLPRVFLYSLTFPAFYVFASLFKSDPQITSLVLYFLWPVFVFLGLPMLGQSEAERTRMVRVLFVANALCWLVPFALDLLTGPVQVRFTEIESFGYVNPDYYAQIFQVLFALTLLALVSGKRNRVWRRRGLFGVLLCTVLGPWFANARNVLLFQVVALVCYFAIRRTSRPLLIASLLLLIAGVAGLFGFQRTDVERVDELSSGRTRKWSAQVDRAWEQDSTARAILIGPSKLPDASRDASYDRLREQKEYSKFHIDNVYLELIFEAGVVGLLLFLLPCGLVLLAAARTMRADPPRAAGSAWAISVLIGIGAQSTVVSTVPTFGNPVSVLFALTVTIACGEAARPRDRTAVASPEREARGQVRRATFRS